MTVDPHHLATAGPAQLRRAALAHRAADLAAASGAQVRLTEVPPQAMVNLRVIPGSADAAAVERELGTELPAPNRVALLAPASESLAVASGAVLWLGPDEFLVSGPEDAAPRLLALPGKATDVSYARAGVDVQGQQAVYLLATGCSLDLHPSVFTKNSCAQTLLARANVLIHRDDDSTYRVLTGTSFANYLTDWLIDAAIEYASGVGTASSQDMSINHVPQRGAGWPAAGAGL